MGRMADAPLLSRWWALAAAAGSGLVLLLAFPPFDAWWGAPVAVALLALATHRRRVRAGLGLGLLAGAAFFTPLLSWAGVVVGPVWLFLPALQTAYVGLLGALAAAVSPALDRWRWSWPLVTGALWVAQEALRDRTPFGGFPWGRLAFSQSDSPLLGLAALGGAPLVTFGVAAVGGGLALAAVVLLDRRRPAGPAAVPGGDPGTGEPAGLPAAAGAGTGGAVARGGPLVAAGIAVLVPLVPQVLPGPAAGSAEPVRVAIVQGNVPRLGLDFNAQRRAVLDNHVDGTLALAADVAAGRTPRPDLVVWPENASDIDPLANADARARIDAAAGAIGVPILVGGLLRGPGDGVRNVGIVWEPGRGPTQTYVKRHPVPFAEYIPLRPLARMITDEVDLVRSDFVAGPAPGVLTVGPVVLGDVICFEVAYDDVVRDTVTGGAELLVVQTNNATFNEAEARQQLAMVRLRAVEHGRPALMASTVGVSGFVTVDGAAHQVTGFNTPAVVSAELTPRSARTMATVLGALPELALVLVALGSVAAAVLTRRRARSERERRVEA
jgi:apolipoprotein N-acyltransferase